MSAMIRSVFATLLLSSSALAHMEMTFPPPFRSQHNPFAVQATIDYSMTSPLSGASQFPCKGYLSDVGTAGGASVASFAQGATMNFTLAGSAVHGGGSCQAALSNDAGKTWYVIHTFQGGCPLAAGDFSLAIPADAPTGSSLFAWTWYNDIGNREIYQNCASVTIAKGSGTASTAFTSRPDMFVANLANGCTTVENGDVLIPNPGPDVTTAGTAKQIAVSGTCAPVNGIGGRTSSSSGSSGSADSGSSAAGSSSITASVAPVASASSASASVMSSATLSSFVTSSPASVAAPSSVVASSSSAAPSSVVAPSSVATGTAPVSTPSSSGTSSGLTVSVDGECSGTQTCLGSTYGDCCSQWGYCGSISDYCGTGCMAGFGSCGVNGTTTSASVRARHVRQFKLRV